MLEPMFSIPAALLRFKNLNTVSNSSVAESELHIGSLKDIKYSM